jgi:glutamate 5-kinase
VRYPVAPGGAVVVKIGSSSLSLPVGGIDDAALGRVVDQVAALRHQGHPTVLVTSGAISAGIPALGLVERPTAIADLQVAAAVGQTRLMERYSTRFGSHGIEVGQVLLTRDVLGNRSQYLNARSAITRMLELGVVPIVNENDTVVVDEVKLGDNDRLAAIVSHLVGAAMLVILTDTSGLFTDDPRLADDAKLVTAVKHSDDLLDQIRSVPGKGTFGSGGVATKVVAARMAAFSGVPTVIAASNEPHAVTTAVAGDEIGTWIDPKKDPLNSRKLWIAFGVRAMGHISIDAGAVTAITEGQKSLLGVGVIRTSGDFENGDVVDVVDEGGTQRARGIVRVSATDLNAGLGLHTSDLGTEVIHRDDLVVF